MTWITPEFKRDYIDPEETRPTKYPNPYYLQLARKARGLSIAELAEMMDEPKSQVGKWDYGEEEVPREKMFKYLNALQFPKSFFYRQSPRMKPETPIFICTSDSYDNWLKGG